MANAGTAAIEARCAKIAGDMGFELVDVCVEKEPTGKYLRFYIDKPEGISLDDCEAYHKAVRSIADSVDYDFMEVSSPGIDRPLKKDRDFERNLGAEIEIKLFKAMDGAKVLTGILAGLEDGDILLETPAGVKRIPRKAAALVKPTVDMEGIEEVDLSENTESGEINDEV
jgi:ribosome maturation factor RimP